MILQINQKTNSKMSRSRSYCYTINNPTEDDINFTFGLHTIAPIRYHVCGMELGANNTPHLQGYVVFEDNKTLTATKSYLPRAHLEMANGSHLQASEYCKKDGNFIEFGILPKTPQETGNDEKKRWDDAREFARAGDFDNIPSDIYIRYRNSLHQIHRDAATSNTVLDGCLQHEWWWGAPGTGKTSRAFREYPDAYIKDPKERWWDGYTGQDVIIVDDFDIYQKGLAGDMKRWMDRYPFQAPVKGGYQKIRPSKIIVTSNYHWDTIWDDETTQSAIARRVKEVKF